VEQTDESIDFTKAPYHYPLALIFGHERTGVEDELLGLCDQVIHIPMLGMGNSHNVAMSAAIITSHLVYSQAHE
jgi:tRNA G18 (ribose-2'-O)-methylase SpoU